MNPTNYWEFLFNNFCNYNKFQYPSDTRIAVSNCYSIKDKTDGSKWKDRDLEAGPTRNYNGRWLTSPKYKKLKSDGRRRRGIPSRPSASHQSLLKCGYFIGSKV